MRLVIELLTWSTYYCTPPIAHESNYGQLSLILSSKHFMVGHHEL